MTTVPLHSGFEITSDSAPERMVSVVFSHAEAFKRLGIAKVNLVNNAQQVNKHVFMEALGADGHRVTGDQNTAALFAKIRIACFTLGAPIRSNLEIAPASEFGPCMCPERHDGMMGMPGALKKTAAKAAFRCE